MDLVQYCLTMNAFWVISVSVIRLLHLHYKTVYFDNRISFSAITRKNVMTWLLLHKYLACKKISEQLCSLLFRNESWTNFRKRSIEVLLKKLNFKISYIYGTTRQTKSSLWPQEILAQWKFSELKCKIFKWS